MDAGHEVSDGSSVGCIVKVAHAFGGLFGDVQCRFGAGLKVVPDLSDGFVQGKAALSDPVESGGAFVKGRVDAVKKPIKLFLCHVGIVLPMP